jgi:hypothetical protein
MRRTAASYFAELMGRARCVACRPTGGPGQYPCQIRDESGIVMAGRIWKMIQICLKICTARMPISVARIASNSVARVKARSMAVPRKATEQECRRSTFVQWEAHWGPTIRLHPNTVRPAEHRRRDRRRSAFASRSARLGRRRRGCGRIGRASGPGKELRKSGRGCA